MSESRKKHDTNSDEWLKFANLLFSIQTFDFDLNFNRQINSTFYPINLTYESQHEGAEDKRERTSDSCEPTDKAFLVHPLCSVQLVVYF